MVGLLHDLSVEFLSGSSFGIWFRREKCVL